jgi:hypothetical protein
MRAPRKTGLRGEGMTIQTLEVGDRLYEQRMNRCGKRICRICYPPGGSGDGVPGHGPYWYMCLQVKGKFRRFYIGKTLDTAKYVGADGRVDFAAYKNRGKGKGCEDDAREKGSEA